MQEAQDDYGSQEVTASHIFSTLQRSNKTGLEMLLGFWQPPRNYRGPCERTQLKSRANGFSWLELQGGACELAHFNSRGSSFSAESQ